MQSDAFNMLDVAIFEEVTYDLKLDNFATNIKCLQHMSTISAVYKGKAEGRVAQTELTNAADVRSLRIGGGVGSSSVGM